jgi:glutathione reductase (NADPH)
LALHQPISLHPPWCNAERALHPKDFNDKAAMTHDYDLFVIGGGSGGVRCARIAASHGAKVAIAEERHWGGTCVNVGCVPKKLMVQAAEYGAYAEDAKGFGWTIPTATHDWAALMAVKNQEITRLNGIYVKLLENSGVQCFEGRASFIDAHTLQVGNQRVSAARIVIAVGGHPAWPDIEGADLGIVSDQAFFLPELPKRVTLVGGGYIGVEFAGIFRGLGAEVDLLYRQRLPLRGFDHEIREHLAEALTTQGINLHPSVLLHRLEDIGSGTKRLHLTDGRSFDSDLVFFAVGRVPNTAKLGAANAGVALTETGAVITDEAHCTSQPHIYAVGDVSNRVNLTPVAIAEGHRLADRLFGAQPRNWSFDPIPTAVFCVPPIGTCGLTEEEAAARGPVDIYTARFTPMRHLMTGRNRPTFIKLVVCQATQRVLGAHMLGDDAAEMMQAIGVAMTAGATKTDFDRTIGIHPTAAEEWVTLRTRTRGTGAASGAA